MPMDSYYTKSDLTVNELLILQSEMRKEGKSLGLAYLMLLGGHLGLHRFYLGKYVSGSIQLTLFILAVVCYWIVPVASGFLNLPDMLMLLGFVLFVGLPGLALFIWIVVDLFLIGGMVRDWNNAIEQKITQKLILLRRNYPITS